MMAYPHPAMGAYVTLVDFENASLMHSSLRRDSDRLHAAGLTLYFLHSAAAVSVRSA